jgi:FkbM family methyltransferase
MNLKSYRQYVHTLVSVYRQYGVTDERARALIVPFEALGSASDEDRLSLLADSTRARLELISPTLTEKLIEKPVQRLLTFGDIEFYVPIINEQGVEWYGSAPMENFDFTVERSIGLLNDAKVIYDFGGHHGVWAAYYSKIVGEGGFVYTFEPSVINLEVSAMLFLINGISNAVNIGAAVGTMTDHDGSKDSSVGMLVDFVEEMRVIDIRSLTWRYGDFMKMDIEGFEYDLLTNFPWLFELAENIHLELHIPHLERRGLDYRDVTAVLPFDEFEIHNSEGGDLQLVTRDTPLSGYCSLMMRRI